MSGCDAKHERAGKKVFSDDARGGTGERREQVLEGGAAEEGVGEVKGGGSIPK